MPQHSPHRFSYHVGRLKNIRINWFISTHTVLRVFLFVRTDTTKKDMYIRQQQYYKQQPESVKKNPPSIRLFCRPSNPFPRVKTPAAYMRVRCYPPARFSNFVKDFLAGAYHQTSKVSQHVFGFCFLDGVAMLWFDVQGHTIG